MPIRQNLTPRSYFFSEFAGWVITAFLLSYNIFPRVESMKAYRILKKIIKQFDQYHQH